MFKLFIDSNEKQLKKIQPLVGAINSLEDSVKKMAREEMLLKVEEWKKELSGLDYEDQKKVMEKILPEAFAFVREASVRTLGKRHFDVQLMAGVVLHEGKISEQKTGEGKTHTATLPLFLNSLTGRGAHLVTPNDYLSRHGAGWMGDIYDYLGIGVGVIMQERAFVYDKSFEGNEFDDIYAVHLREVSRQEAYKCGIVYGTNHEFGFDYLRDNMVRSLGSMVQTNPNGEFGVHNFAIVDEVDSILIDVERLLGVNNLYEQDFEMVHLMEEALTAHALYEKDRDYVVKDGKIVIVDQFTGRLLPSNRFSHGLHQAIEAKEGVEIQQESKTLAEISYQNYFRMYKKLAGMTGTAATEAEEFYKIYKLDVVVIPTNQPNIRKDQNDVVYKTESAKFKAVADDIVERHAKGQPVLVGTTSVEKSEQLHELLSRRKVPHEILNAKNHEREALIIAQAGRKGGVTISTNMAGRGVDIVLGGDPPVENEQKEGIDAGGLYVIGTERHDSRRIDNQLRGRSGRQGDPGETRFFVSLQDDLMRIFGGEQVSKMMDRFGIDETIPLEAGLVTKSIENAQKRVEGFNFDRRKQVV